jgi:hypothetical protein
MKCKEPDWDGTIYAVVTFEPDGSIRDMEFLDEPPKWDLEENNQACFVGNVNGGDSKLTDAAEGWQ